MRRGPKPGRRAPDANAIKAQRAWRQEMPEWVGVLAAGCDRHGQTAMAERLGYAPSVVSQVLSRSYRGDYGAVEQAVRAALLAERVACPILGDLALADCLDNQDAASRGVRGSELRIRLARACPGCTNNRKRRNVDAEQ